MKALFALTELTRLRLYGERSLPEIEGVEIYEVDVTHMTAEQWEHCLSVELPDILVAGWGTPMLPERVVINSNRSIRYLCYLCGEVKKVVPRALLEAGVPVTNWGSEISYTIAEHAVLLVLAALRNITVWPVYMQGVQVDAKRAIGLQSLRGRRVGVHGFGAIARELVPILQVFRAEVRAFSLGVPEHIMREYGIEPAESLQELFEHSEVVIECEALREDTRLSVDEGVLNALPDDAVFVNVGRGSVVDEDALARVALAKSLRLGLDVFQEEPLPLNSALRQVPGVLLSPHVAGPTSDAFVYCTELAHANLRRFVMGEALQARVTLESYDQST
ncbi:MAG TPA: hydroxyacid dehydrogenase [Opitutae bacterium]|nr:hydroxyacid dehydrogenase [Puniceicoccaceae bacterium]HBR95635.1 hydroxyacid dehydrogenase [Opitutae bacterium]|tara:strand:- start:15556 stop:16554 length:999 start_codon:yes stop_codon:yes gene_type:complete